MTYTRWLMGLLLGLMIIGSSAAQDASQPLVLLKANAEIGTGDLWEWTGGTNLRQKTQWGYNEELRLSPLNDEIAYHSWARLWVDHIQQNGMTSGGRFPGNIWIIANDSSDDGTRIGDQPAEAVITEQGVADNTLLRSAPMWSPDGTQIAWAEKREHAFEAPDTYRLVVYDKATQATRTLVEALPPQYGIDTGLEAYWVADSIVILSYPESAANLSDVSFLVFDATTGEQRFDIAASSFVEGEMYDPALAMPVEYMGKSWLGILHTYPEIFGQWNLIDVQTGEVVVPESEPPSAVAAAQPDTSIEVGVHFASSGENILYFASRQSDGRQLELGLTEDQFIRNFALSPDGEAIAYQIYDRATDTYDSTVYVWHDGVVTQVPQTADSLITEFVWGATLWKIDFSALGQ